MLAGKQSRRHDNGDLRPVHRRRKRRAQSDLGFAETDIAANQPVHGTPFGQIGQHVLNALFLVLRFGIRETRAKIIVNAFGYGQPFGFAQMTFGGNLYQRVRHVA